MPFGEGLEVFSTKLELEFMRQGFNTPPRRLHLRPSLKGRVIISQKFCNGMTNVLVPSSRKKAIDPATSLQLIKVILDFSFFGSKGFQPLVMKLHFTIIKARG
jgi:hypothetical protein